MVEVVSSLVSFNWVWTVLAFVLFVAWNVLVRVGDDLKKSGSVQNKERGRKLAGLSSLALVGIAVTFVLMIHQVIVVSDARREARDETVAGLSEVYGIEFAEGMNGVKYPSGDGFILIDGGVMVQGELFDVVQVYREDDMLTVFVPEGGSSQFVELEPVD